MRHRRGPALPGASAKWHENTINCRGQLNNKCMRPARPAGSRFASERKSGLFGEDVDSCAADSARSVRPSTSPRTGRDVGRRSSLFMESRVGPVPRQHLPQHLKTSHVCNRSKAKDGNINLSCWLGCRATGRPD